MIFTGAGYKVSLYDIKSEQVSGALSGIQETLARYEKEGNLRGNLTAAQQSQLVTGSSDLAECMLGAVHVQVTTKCITKCNSDNATLENHLNIVL